MNLFQIIGVASIVDPELADRALGVVKEIYIRELAQEAGLPVVVADLAVKNLREERKNRLAVETKGRSIR